MAKVEFNFGDNQQEPAQADLFGGSPIVEPEAPPSADGATPILPLQPKEIRLEKIRRATARRVWLELHYLHRDFSNPSLELGVFDQGLTEMVGAIAFSARLGGS